MLKAIVIWVAAALFVWSAISTAWPALGRAKFAIDARYFLGGAKQREPRFVTARAVGKKLLSAGDAITLAIAGTTWLAIFLASSIVVWLGQAALNTVYLGKRRSLHNQAIAKNDRENALRYKMNPRDKRPDE